MSTVNLKECMRGVDVSGYNSINGRPIDWVAAKADGVDFAILKIIRKDLSPDKQFEINWKNCVDAGVIIQGVYNYTYATTISKAISDATRVLEVLGRDRHIFVWLDWEWGGLPKGRIAADIINAYGDVITAGGCEFGIYFGMYYYDKYLDDIMPYVRPEYRKGWEARYYKGYTPISINDTINENYRPRNFDGTFYGWQCSSSGKVAGIETSVDIDIWYQNIEAETLQKDTTDNYHLSDFVLDSRRIFGVGDTASAAEILSKTITVSVRKNKNHEIVTPLERYFKALGYYTGSIEADRGKDPLFGNGMAKATALYQRYIVKAMPRYQDGILTAKASTWKTLYGVKSA